MKYHLLPLLLATALLFAGCKKDPAPVNPGHNDSSSIAFLLNEGAWGGNDASISRLHLDSDDIENHWFRANNGRDLGDLAQDLVHYGNKLYATIHSSNKIEVIDPATGKSLKQIDMGQRGPRYIAPHQGKIYISCYDKTIVRIDTLSLEIEAACPLSGMQPEQLCAIGDSLYVCNCWQYDANGDFEYDSTVSVVDIPRFIETGKIAVGQNPGRIKAVDSHRFVVACSGNYQTNIPATTLLVDIADGSRQTLPVAATNFDIYNNTLYIYQTTYDAQWHPTALFYTVDLSTLQASPILQNHASSIPNAYGINIHPATGNLYICNSPYNANADIYTFRPDGTLLRKVEGGILSSKVVF